MTFQPVIPTGGIVGWRFLQRTYDNQFQSFSSSLVNERETRYFLENIGKVESAEQLVSDRRLLQVALGAFGLEGDLDNRFFVRKILEDGTQANDALSNRLADKRYREFSDAFGFGPGDVRKTALKTNMEKIAKANVTTRFEVAVGDSDETMRISLYAQRELADLANTASSADTKWFELMGLPPLAQHDGNSAWPASVLCSVGHRQTTGRIQGPAVAADGVGGFGSVFGSESTRATDRHLLGPKSGCAASEYDFTGADGSDPARGWLEKVFDPKLDRPILDRDHLSVDNIFAWVLVVQNGIRLRTQSI
ncbi:DUF1217 domain-containing protein [Ruegeria sp. HKCCE4150]|uniref:DUF1217 domain-containing protein n=1 Tax=Ruegeria sp. HKCCE4150 TaxID=2794828 RepID=UPI003F9339AD